MARRILRLMIVASLCLLLAAWLSACGGDEAVSTDTQLDEPVTTETDSTNGNGGDSNNRFDELADIEATVEVIVNGESTVIWSQKDGNWRWQDPQDPESYVIYNDEAGKLWVVNNKVATESDEAGEDSMYWGMGPSGMLGMYTMLPGGTMNDDTYEINVPGEGKIVVEFKGPQGLPSKFSTIDASGNAEESIVFEYTDVGNVSDDLFVLAADVTIQTMPDIPSVPGGGSMPEIPQM